MDSMFFWLAKPVAELLFAVAVGVICLVVLLLVSLPTMIRQARCKHDHAVRETSACDAICDKCGKNLGFIGTWRKSRATKET